MLASVAALCAVVSSPVVFGLSAADHENEEATVLVNGIDRLPPLQIVALEELVIEGLGLMLKVNVFDAPIQPPPEEVGVTV